MDNNTQKMRETLAEIRLLLARVPRSIKSDVACGIIAAKAKHALAAPPRNCDVGTAEEQEARFLQFCRRYKRCVGCPFNDWGGQFSAVPMHCIFRWYHTSCPKGGAS